MVEARYSCLKPIMLCCRMYYKIYRYSLVARRQRFATAISDSHSKIEQTWNKKEKTLTIAHFPHVKPTGCRRLHITAIRFNEMGDRTRNKPGSCGPEEEEKVNWGKEFLKEKEAKEKIQEIRITEALNMGMLKSDLTHANTELLRMKGKMSPRGAIEFFEERGSSLSLNQRKLSRGDKWKVYYQNDYKGFKKEMQLKFPNLISMPLVQQENFVDDLVRQTYSNTSCFHHYFDLQEGVFICPKDYPQDQMSFLEIVCKCLPCKYTTV